MKNKEGLTWTGESEYRKTNKIGNDTVNLADLVINFMSEEDIEGTNLQS